MGVGGAFGPGLRRALDIGGALLLLGLAAPLLALAALAVRVTSGRPVLFGHERLGLDGRPYRCLKFRTMIVEAELRLEDDASLHRRYVENGYKLPNGSDPRVTRVGRFLRRTYLDELPQLVNVLNGSMSLIGPRPIVRHELRLFGEGGADLLRHKPGIFGEWVSRGRHRPPYPERVDVELGWVRNRSFRRDMVVLARSVRAVLEGQADG